jgi:lipoprotein Spr
MMKRIFVFLLVIIALYSIGHHGDRFQQVIDQQSNHHVIQKLIDFKEDGIEESVNTQKYDVEKVINYANTFMHTPHKMGGTTKKGIDCSGLVMVTHARYGIILPHSSEEQARYGRLVADMKDLQPGDVVFFYGTYNTSHFITHSGIYLGDDDFIHTSASRGVIVSKINDPYYWKDKFLFGTRYKST